MKRLIVISCIVLFAVITKAQQVGDYTSYFYKPMLFNPAYTGVQGNINAAAFTHIQWTGFSNAPQFNAFAIDGKLKKKKIGLGFNVTNNQQGITGQTGAAILYSYSLALNKYTRLAFGVSLGMMNHTVNFSKAIVENTTDPVLATQSQSKIAIDGSAGIALIAKKFEFGFSAPQLIGNNIKYNTQFGTTTNYDQPSQYLTYLKYNYFINEENGISLSPIFIIRNVPHSPFQFDGGLMFNWKKKLSVAAIYKSNYAMSASVGFWVYRRLNVAYSYDFALGSIAAYSGQTHELLVSYTFGKEELPPKETDTDSIGGAKMKDLNSVLLEKLLGQIDSIFSNPKATKDDYRRLIESITQYSNSHFSDPNLRKLAKEYTQKLLELEKQEYKESINAVVKGQIQLTGSKSKPDFSNITIQLIDKATGTLIGVYAPKPRNGKYILILKPGEKYILKIEKEGFQTFSKEINPAVKKESYEIKQVIKLKKAKVIKSKKK